MDEIEKYSIIGKGAFGIVLHPAILCSEMSNDKEHYVSKILQIKQAEKEIASLKALPKELDGILYFTENSYCIVDETNKGYDRDALMKKINSNRMGKEE
jgi:hypothetical protein